jgi:hypothetical protein
MKIRSVEVKPSATCRKILRHWKIPAKYDRGTSLAKLMDISRQVSPCFGTRCPAGICQRALVDKLGMIKALIGLKNLSSSAGFEPANLGSSGKHDNH